MARSQEKIRIAYVINDMLYGGAQQMLFELAAGLDRSKFEPVVYYLNEYPQSRKNVRAQFETASVKTLYIGDGGKTSVGNAVWALRSQFRKFRPHIVHTHLVDATLAGVLAAKMCRTRSVIVHEHQTHTQFSQKIQWAYSVIRHFTRLTICYSPSVEEELFGAVHELTAIPMELMNISCTIRNGINLKRIDAALRSSNRASVRQALNIPMEAFVVISVARLIAWKGQRNLITAVAPIAVDVDIHVLLVGEGEDETLLREQSRLLDIEERVHLLGLRDDVYQLLMASDVSSLAYVYENTDLVEAIGIAGYESMAIGIPLIASDYPSSSGEVHPGQNAILVPPNNLEALEVAIRSLAANSELREEIGSKARDRIRATLNWEAILPVYERIYLSFA